MYQVHPIKEDMSCLDIPTVFRKLNHVSCDDDSWLVAFEYYPEQSSVDEWPNLDT